MLFCLSPEEFLHILDILSALNYRIPGIAEDVSSKVFGDVSTRGFLVAVCEDFVRALIVRTYEVVPYILSFHSFYMLAINDQYPLIDEKARSSLPCHRPRFIAELKFANLECNSYLEPNYTPHTFKKF